MTKSGMLAGAHLVGISGLLSFIRSGGAQVEKDGAGTPITQYIENYGNYAMPFTMEDNLDRGNVIEDGSGKDTLRGFGGADTLIGNAEDDVLVGGDGDDTFVSGAGSDLVWGGDENANLIEPNGHDKVDYSASPGGVRVAFAGVQGVPAIAVEDRIMHHGARPGSP